MFKKHGLYLILVPVFFSCFRYPPPPDHLHAGKGSCEQAVELTWNAPDKTVGFMLYRRDENETHPVFISRTTKPFYRDAEALDWRKNYLYSVASVNSRGDQGPRCREVLGFPRIPPPRNVSASDGSEDEGVLVTWTPVIGTDRYKVARTTDSFCRMREYRADSQEQHLWKTSDTRIYTYGVRAWDPVHKIFGDWGTDLGFYEQPDSAPPVDIMRE